MYCIFFNSQWKKNYCAIGYCKNCAGWEITSVDSKHFNTDHWEYVNTEHRKYVNSCDFRDYFVKDDVFHQ